MKKVVPVLLDMHKDDFTLKGKRVSIRDLEKTTRNINYDDFFKARISKDSDGYDISFFCKDGTDILSFIILGMNTSLSSLGVFDTEFGFKSGAHDYLYDLADFLTSRGYPVVSTSDDFDKTLSALNRIYLENDVTLQTIKRHASESEYKSLYFVSSFGTSMFRPNISTMSGLISYLTCLSFSEEGRKKIVEAFCYFAPAIVISGAQVFSGVSSEYLKSLNSIYSSVLSSYFSGNKYLKFRYENFKLNDTVVVSDIEGVSFFLAFYYASILTFGSKASSFFNLDKKSVSSILGSLLGNDYVNEYLLDGTLSKFLSALSKDKAFNYELNDSYYELDICGLYACVKFIQDLETLGIDVKDLNGSSALYFMYATYKDTYFSLLKNGGQDVLRGYSKEIDLVNKTCQDKVKYYKSRNSELSKKNSSLSSQVSILSKEIEELKSISTSVRKDDYDSLKESYALSLDKISMLSRQCDELELKLKDSESAMNELLSSLEYNEEDSTSDVSLESMIEFLNGFNICFVGGRNDMKERLNSMGLYNFIQLTCENDINRLGNFDFMVSMTKFVSHKVFYGALGKLGSDRDKHHYFNGTNLNSLIQSCYEFINRYFDICS